MGPGPFQYMAIYEGILPCMHRRRSASPPPPHGVVSDFWGVAATTFLDLFLIFLCFSYFRSLPEEGSHTVNSRASPANPDHHHNPQGGGARTPGKGRGPWGVRGGGRRRCIYCFIWP